MKILMIGADGAHEAAFRRGWTPYIEERLAKADILPVEEDLISRGWSRIALGRGADITGALYDRPDLGGGFGWSLKFRMGDVPGYSSKIKPIWQVVNEMGVKVGIMNLPTVFPADKVDGFFVSGGGGGAPIVQDVEDSFCHPVEIADSLRDWGYIVDERQTSLLVEKRIDSAKELFDRLSLKNERRAAAFTKLSKKYGVDFGFCVFKSSSVLAELLVLSELAASERRGGKADKSLMEAAENYYRHFDSLVQGLVENFPGAEVLMVSDHGSIVPKYYLNTNILLEKLGYQSRFTANRLIARIGRRMKRYLPYVIREKLKKSGSVKSRWRELSAAPPNGATAFSTLLGSWRNGIYINDSERFGGPVKPGLVQSVSRKLVEEINSDQEMLNHGIKAILRPSHETVEAQSVHYPDIILSMPDEIITSPINNKVISNVSMPKAPLGLKGITGEKLLCVKSSQALAANLTGSWITSGDSPDLTAVYRHITEYFKHIQETPERSTR
jgi:predicted AlkP superfamily phosphohydrolase/phosphomutase